MVSYSAWIWSPEHEKYYSAVYDDSGQIVEYHWQGGYRQYVQPTKPPHEPSVADVAESIARLQVSEPSRPRTLGAQQQTSDTSVRRISNSIATSSSQSYQQQGSNATSPNYIPAVSAPTATSAYGHNTSPTLNSSVSPQTNYQASQQAVNSYFDIRTTSQVQHGSSQGYYNASSQQYTPSQQHTPSQTYSTSQQYAPSQAYANSQPYTNTQQHTTSAQSPSYTQRTRPNQPAPLPSDIQDVVGGDKKNRHIKSGDDGSNYEKLHPSFKRIATKDHDEFFCRGRVFKMLWTEPAGMVNQNLGGTRGSTHYSLVRFNEGAYSEIRRFVVIQNKGNFSQCIPIQSYRGQGATKPGLIVADHAIIYTGFPGAKPPSPFPGEENMLKQALRVHPYRSESLNAASRINFGKPYAVEHNVKLAEIGIVADDHLHILVTYFMKAMGLPIY